MASQPEEWDRELDELGSELRQNVGDEFRREAEEVERLVELQRLRRRSLGEAATEIMARGDLVVAQTTGAAFTGQIAAAHGDLLTLKTSDGSVDLNLDVVTLIQVVERRQAGGLDTAPGSRSFRARLSEYEQTGEPLTLIISPTGDRMSGRVRVVAADHAVVTDDAGRDSYLPMGAIAAVVRSRRLSQRPAAPDEL